MAPYFDDLKARLPLKTGLLGEVAGAAQQSIFRDLDKQTDEELAGFDWVKRERIHGAVATPIMFKGRVLGVIVGFTWENMPTQSLPWGWIFADHIGTAVANTRAFEEIQRLKAQMEQQNAYLQEEVVEAKAFGDLVGQSAALKQIITQIDLVAPTEASVLIQGDTGTGKELVAREIHRRSLRKDKPLVRVNCASIPAELYESEFFGHVRGAFTGAIKDRAGRFETAEGGTLFLDEIAEIPLELQGKLLRVLQEKCYERVGDDRTRHADVRIIAASNRDLKKEVDSHRFREDLYYRLNVFLIRLTPLKERKDDIPFLAKHFIELSVKDLKCPSPKLTRAGVLKLQSYLWPGNIRELRNVIERAVILARGGVLEFDLPTVSSTTAITGLVPQDGNPSPLGFLTEQQIQGLERDNLLNVLSRTHWKIRGENGAAELLGVKATTLSSRIKKMGLKNPLQ